MVARFLSTLSLALLVAWGCASPPPSFDEIPPAEELYQQGLETLEGRRILGIYRRVNYSAWLRNQRRSALMPWP